MPKCEGCVFDIKVATVAVYKGFEKSPAAGVVAIKRTIEDFVSHLKEEHDFGYFKNGLRRGIDSLTGLRDVFWPGYDRTVGQSMRRNEGLLIVNQAPKDELAKAREERRVWQDHLLPVILDLQEGEAVQFLALKSTTAGDGVAFQQVSMKNGELILESQLMPFNQEGNINAFTHLVSETGEDSSVVSAADVDPAVGWMVKGRAIDFKNDLPQMIIRSLLPDEIETMNWQQELNPVWPQLNRVIDFGPSIGELIPVAVEPSIVEEPIDRVTSVEPSSFWWQLLAQQASEEIVATELVSETPEIVVSEKKPLSVEVVEPIESVVAFQSVKTIPIMETHELKPQTAKQPEKKKESVPAKEVRIEQKREVGQRKEVIKATIYQAEKPKKQEKGFVTKPSAFKQKVTVSKIEEKKVIRFEKVIEKTVIEPKKAEPEIPWWQISFEGIDANDVPEIPFDGILWPDFNYLKDLSWLVSIRQFALANTNWDQIEDDLVMVPRRTNTIGGVVGLKKQTYLNITEVRKKLIQFD